MHHAEGESGVGAGQRAYVPVRGGSRARLEWIHHDDLRAPVLRLANERPEMQVGDNSVGAPQEDEAALGQVLGQHPHRGAHRRLDTSGSGAAADCTFQARGAQAAEKRPLMASLWIIPCVPE